MEHEQVQQLRCPRCGRELAFETYVCGYCGCCQYCCNCSADTLPESTLPGD